MQRRAPQSILTQKQRERIENLLLDGMSERARKKKLSVCAWISQRTKIAQGTVEAYVAHLNSTKNRLLIIENTSESIEKRSESKHLQELFRLYDWNSAIKTRSQGIQSKEQFITALQEAKEWYIHISSHGIFCKKSKTSKIAIPHGSEVEAEDIEKIWVNRSKDKTPKLVVLSACETGRKEDLARSFAKAGCKHFIAPRDKVPWIDAAIFNTLFYNYLFVDRMSVWCAYKKTLTRMPGLGGAYRYYEWGKRFWMVE